MLYSIAMLRARHVTIRCSRAVARIFIYPVSLRSFDSSSGTLDLYAPHESIIGEADGRGGRETDDRNHVYKYDPSDNSHRVSRGGEV